MIHVARGDRMSIERFLLINFSANLLLLAVSVRAVGKVSPVRVAACSLLGAVYALIAFTPGCSWLRHPLCAGACLILMSLGACPPGSLKKRVRACVSFAVCAAMTGGVQLALDNRPNALLFLSSAILYLFYGGMRRRSREERSVRLMLSLGRSRIELSALVDTGNRLHEPLSGLPVLIVEKRFLEKELGRETLEDMQRQAGLVSFRSLNSRGEMPCLRARGLQIVERKGVFRPAGDVCVALCEHTLCGEHPAIAPIAIFDEA